MHFSQLEFHYLLVIGSQALKVSILYLVWLQHSVPCVNFWILIGASFNETNLQWKWRSIVVGCIGVSSWIQTIVNSHWGPK